MDLPMPLPAEDIATPRPRDPVPYHRPRSRPRPGVRLRAFRPGLSSEFPRRRAARRDRAPPQRGLLRRRAVRGATLAGAPLLAATFPRAFCDPNREPWELDPAMFADALPAWVNTTSARVGAGLGTLARVVASGEAIYRRNSPSPRPNTGCTPIWEPYHAALQTLLEVTRDRFGACLLIDCHSMPAQSSGSGRGVRRLRFGRRAWHGVRIPDRRVAEALLTDMGFRCAATTPMPVVMSPGTMDGRGSAFMRCRSRWRARSIWMRHGCSVFPASPRYSAS